MVDGLGRGFQYIKGREGRTWCGCGAVAAGGSVGVALVAVNWLIEDAKASAVEFRPEEETAPTTRPQIITVVESLVWVSFPFEKDAASVAAVASQQTLT